MLTARQSLRVRCLESAPSSQWKRWQQLPHFKSYSTSHGDWRNWKPPGLFTPKMTCLYFILKGSWEHQTISVSWLALVEMIQSLLANRLTRFFRVKLKGYVRVGHRVCAELWSAPTQRSALSSLHKYPAKVRSGMVCYPTNQSSRQAVDRSVNHNRFLHIWTFFSSGFL